MSTEFKNIFNYEIIFIENSGEGQYSPKNILI